jgi:thiol-disulfide isomerase/thioredoxin
LDFSGALSIKRIILIKNQVIKILFVVFLTMAACEASAQIKTGQPAPELSLPDGNGNPVQLSSLVGSVVLIDFWASWCGPCRMNNPHLVKLYGKYHNKGLEILGISLDNNSQAWKAAIGQDGIRWPQVIDIKGWDAASAATYGVNSIPASFLLDRNGVIRAVNLVGWRLESKIKTLLKK